MNGDDNSDIIIEVLEVFINHILYIREVYPQEIFKKRKMYNTPVYVSIYPPLNNYLVNILTAARELKKNKSLYKVDMIIYQNEEIISEKYSFELNEDWMESKSNNDTGLLDFEEHLRNSLYSFTKRAKCLSRLGHNARFQIQLQTTQDAFFNLSHNSKLQNFPWLRKFNDTNCADEISILPVTPVGTAGLRILIKIPS